MKKMLLTALILLPLALRAQQNLNDPAYIYSLDKNNERLMGMSRAVYQDLNTPDPDIALIFKNKLYTGINYTRFYLDSGLGLYEILACNDWEDIRAFTADTSIKHLFIFGKEKPKRPFHLE